MPSFEIEFNNGLYSGTYDVTENGLDLHNVVKHDEGEHPITKPSILKQLEEEIEGLYEYEISEERAQLDFENCVSVAEMRRDEY
jgi:hypothetical protein